MLLDEMGEEDFFYGLKLYIHRHEFENTESKDSWRALQDCGHVKVADKMKVWTKMAGYPVVVVTEEHADGDPNSEEVVALRLHQKRFVVGDVQDDREETLYPLRISLRSEAGIDMYDTDEREISIPVHGKTL